jgi:hypothetical protein
MKNYSESIFAKFSAVGRSVLFVFFIAALVFSFIPSVFGETMPASLSSGQKLTITYSLNTTFTPSSQYTFFALYNGDVFELTDYSHWENNSTGNEEFIDCSSDYIGDFGFDGVVLYTFNPISQSMDINGVFYTLTLTAKTDIANVAQNLSFLAGRTGQESEISSGLDYQVVLGGSDSPYTITPNRADNVEVKAGGAPFSVDVTLTADPETSPYASAQAELTYDPDLVTPDLESVTPALATVSEKVGGPGTLTVVSGPSSGDTVGEGVTLATIPFMPIDEGAAKFNVSEGATISLNGQSEDDPDIVAASGKELEVIISAGSSQPTFNTDVSYEGAPNGCALLTYEADKAANGYTYDGEPMYWSSKLGAYLYIVDMSDFDAENIYAGASPADAKELAYDGNLNGGEVRVSDAQIVYDIIDGHANYNTLDGLGVEARLAADVNGDGSVDQEDIDAILDIIHGR